MENPYEGYLNGAAALTTANAEYQRTIQEATLLREEAVRSRMDTRKKIIKQAEYERAACPTRRRSARSSWPANSTRPASAPP
jgi:hypothetical protein